VFKLGFDVVSDFDMTQNQLTMVWFEFFLSGTRLSQKLPKQTMPAHMATT